MSFSKDIARFRKHTLSKAEKVKRGTGISLFSKIVLRTPVGNPINWKSKPPKGYIGGRLRGNWQVESGKPASGTKGIDPTGSLTIAAGTANALRNRLGVPLFITNNLPYAIPVEHGHSQIQAPAGMVRITLTEFKREVAKQARKAR
jgi:hypothetical protein